MTSDQFINIEQLLKECIISKQKIKANTLNKSDTITHIITYTRLLSKMERIIQF